MPLIVAETIKGIGLYRTLSISTVIAVFCGLVVWIPGIDGKKIMAEENQEK